ncbi:MAG: hypothetical protein E7552_06055 [Ruminococcaceae bacterium]|nr:hypothetical protein [Oscillospiraceae bacterium]
MPYEKSGWDIPDYELEAIVKCFLPDIQEFFASDEGTKNTEKCTSQARNKKPNQRRRIKQGREFLYSLPLILQIMTKYAIISICV